MNIMKNANTVSKGVAEANVASRLAIKGTEATFDAAKKEEKAMKAWKTVQDMKNLKWSNLTAYEKTGLDVLTVQTLDVPIATLKKRLL